MMFQLEFRFAHNATASATWPQAVLKPCVSARNKKNKTICAPIASQDVPYSAAKAGPEIPLECGLFLVLPAEAVGSVYEGFVAPQSRSPRHITQNACP